MLNWERISSPPALPRRRAGRTTEYAGMAELADALDLGSCGQPCGFDSHYPYQNREIRICLPWATDSGFSFPCMKRHRPGAESAAAVSPRYRRRFSAHTARISSGREKDDFRHFSSRRKKDEIYHCFRPCNDFYHPCHVASFCGKNRRCFAPKQVHICV